MHTKSTLMFVVLTAAMMIFLVPMLIEQAHAVTVSIATIFPNFRFPDLHFTNVIWHLDKGFWVQKPKVVGGIAIDWETAGGDPARGRTGSEIGAVGADLALEDGHVIGHATFFFRNPLIGKNSCDTQVSSSASDLRVVKFPCHITSGNFAKATYQISVREID